jgi:Fur family transcriptional regulator, ferric uptake regulator
VTGSPSDPALPLGARLTPQRRAVLEALSFVSGRFTVGELHERARHLHDQLGLATTYRTLELLRETGAVRLLAAESGPGYIRCHPGHHHHLVCVDCGDVQETELCAAPPEDLLRARYGFVPESHDLDIYGRCRNCA